jgi:hypothetical protein
LLRYDANAAKTKLAERLKITGAIAGSIGFYGSKPSTHETIFKHCQSELPRQIKYKDEVYTFWYIKPQAENHFFDCLVGVLVLADISGCKPPSAFTPEATTRPAPPMAPASVPVQRPQPQPVPQQPRQQQRF